MVTVSRSPFSKEVSFEPGSGGARRLAREFCALSHSTHRRPRPADRPTPHFGDLLDRRDGREQSVAPTAGALGPLVFSVANSQSNAPRVKFAQRSPPRRHTSLQAPTPHFMIIVAAHARHFHSRRPVAGALGPLDSALPCFRTRKNAVSKFSYLLAKLNREYISCSHAENTCLLKYFVNVFERPAKTHP